MKPCVEILESRDCPTIAPQSGLFPPLMPDRAPYQLTQTVSLVNGHTAFIADPDGTRAQVVIAVLDQSGNVIRQVPLVGDSQDLIGFGLSGGLDPQHPTRLTAWYQVGSVLHSMFSDAEFSDAPPMDARQLPSPVEWMGEGEQVQQAPSSDLQAVVTPESPSAPASSSSATADPVLAVETLPAVDLDAALALASLERIEAH